MKKRDQRLGVKSFAKEYCYPITWALNSSRRLFVFNSRFILAIITLLTALSASALEVGAPAPEVIGINQSNQTINFKEHYKKGYVLVFFYPRANTPGCTAQNKSLRDSFKPLSEKGVKIFGVSTDSVSKQKDFHSELGLPFDLISDEKEVIANSFGVPVRLGFASRQAFLIREGKVAWVDHNAATSNQASDVLKAIESLEKTTPAGKGK